VKTWKKLYPNVDVKIILIAHAIPKEYEEYKDHIILFEPIEFVLTSYTAQVIRLILRFHSAPPDQITSRIRCP
jgi:hypothetical protein